MLVCRREGRPQCQPCHHSNLFYEAFAAPLQGLRGAFAAPWLRFCFAFRASLVREVDDDKGRKFFVLLFAGVSTTRQLILSPVQVTSMASTKLLASTTLLFGVEVC